MSAVRVEKSGSITTIVLHRPERKNAVDRATADALAEAFTAFEADAEAKVAVLWGDGGTFCAGADLKAIAEGAPNRVLPFPEGRGANPRGGEPQTTHDGDGPMGPTRMVLKKPTIAAISGFAVAGGLELALLCDLRVVEEDATLGVFCRRWGVPLIDGGTVRLPRVVGLGRALDLILTGRAVDAREALAMGLATKVVAKGAARAEAEALGRLIASHPTACMLHDRMSAYESFDLDFEGAMRNELTHGIGTFTDGEVQGGAARFSARPRG